MPQNPPQIVLLDPLTLRPPRLPAELAGLRLLHITDLHIRKPGKRLARLLAELQSPAYEGCDLLLVTGDVMHGPGHESAALDYLGQLIDAARPRYGAFGSFGNHDSDAFIEAATSGAGTGGADAATSGGGHLPITWLRDAAHRMADLPINLLGLRCSRTDRAGDLPAALLDEAYDPAGAAGAAESQRLRILLSHYPTWLIPAAEVGIDLVFSGHTHGGQIRMPGGRTLYNSCPDWPLNQSCGVVQHLQTLQVISRGLGESNVPGLRIFCKPHAPLITLQPADDTSAEGAAVDPTTHEPTLKVQW